MRHDWNSQWPRKFAQTLLHKCVHGRSVGCGSCQPMCCYITALPLAPSQITQDMTPLGAWNTSSSWSHRVGRLCGVLEEEPDLTGRDHLSAMTWTSSPMVSQNQTHFCFWRHYTPKMYLRGVCGSNCSASGDPRLSGGADDQGSCRHAPVLCAQGHALRRHQRLCECHLNHSVSSSMC